MASLDELLNQLVDTDDAEEAKDNDEELFPSALTALSKTRFPTGERVFF